MLHYTPLITYLLFFFLHRATNARRTAKHNAAKKNRCFCFSDCWQQKRSSGKDQEIKTTTTKTTTSISRHLNSLNFKSGCVCVCVCENKRKIFWKQMCVCEQCAVCIATKLQQQISWLSFALLFSSLALFCFAFFSSSKYEFCCEIEVG